MSKKWTQYKGGLEGLPLKQALSVTSRSSAFLRWYVGHLAG
ncbi:MAG: hypothetical protein N3E41_08485 [Thermofilaceae archaeon]|nr:hypothetical protein [Thermofilaceae archaeon]MDW8004849.1 hypothetical protein [Thermofilaceae archaeon]